MSAKWPKVKLGEVLTERREAPSPDALASGRVRIVEKIGFNTGRIQLRSDGETKTDMILIRPGDLVLSGINAAKGAVAIYDKNKAEPVAATIHYGAYIPNPERVSIDFLWLMLRSRFFQELLLEYVPGGIKTELKDKRLLPIPVPLPPLTEQQRILARIEELAAKIEEARFLRQMTMETFGAFIVATHIALAANRYRKLGDILLLDEEAIAVTPDQEYPQVGVRGFGGGLFSKPAITGTQTTYRTFNRLFEGALVLSQVKGWEGAVAVCDRRLAGRFVSPEYRTFRCVPVEAIPDYLKVLTEMEWFWTQLKNATRGVGARRERTRPEQFLSLEMPMPNVQQQAKALETFKHAEVLKRLQMETGGELDALLPSILDKAFKGEL